MKTSESIINITKALISAQAEMPKAKKDSDNPYFGSKYADLAEIIDISRPILAKHGLAIIQFPSTNILADGKTVVVITSRILHESGEWLEDSLSLMPVKSDPQSMGSCISYARRYSWQSICGIAAEDDDSNAASGLSGAKSPAQQNYEQKKAQQQQPPAAPPSFNSTPVALQSTPPTPPSVPPQQPPVNTPSAPNANQGAPNFTAEQQNLKNAIIDVATKLGVVDAKQMIQLASEALSTPNPQSLRLMSVDELNKFLAFLNAKLAQPQNPAEANKPTF